MTFLLDDLLLKPLVRLVEILHDMAVRARHDLAAIRDDLKENRLLFELGERDAETYERRKETLETRLAEAREAREHLTGRARVIR